MGGGLRVRSGRAVKRRCSSVTSTPPRWTLFRSGCRGRDQPASASNGRPDCLRSVLEARIQRQDILRRDPALHLWVVLDEAVLRRTVGDAGIMARQFEHLLDVAKSPNVDVQILPFSAGAHTARAGHFVILGRDDEREPVNSMAIVYIEMRRRGLYLDDAQDVGAHKLTFDYLRSQALDTRRPPPGLSPEHDRSCPHE
ncbi:DUF5753 domain-containing protein [Streptomyces sp. TRM72054]|uniref:DUF5753 domain-containing protein n=1 Tax=Streptomyces sp. TRM72054 TaxID=2870562 RepID=UPI001C8C8CA5|nr:DUF5753 domain-containing protein [Streptomyces sp. TRM72054]